MSLDAELLAVWERGKRASPLQRGLLLMRLALPEHSAEELAQLSIATRDRTLTQLRRRLFGSAFDGHVECPCCGERLGVEIELPEQSSDIAPAGEFTTRAGLRFRPPDSDDLAAIADASSTDEALRALLRRCCSSPEATMPECWTADEIAEIETGLAALEPDGEICIDVRCTGCGHDWQSALDPAGLLWEEVDATAVRLMHAVHSLAAAYGWGEREILELPESRRMAYLQMVDA